MRSRVLAVVVGCATAACSSESAAPVADASIAAADAGSDAPTFLDSTTGDVVVSTDVAVDPLDDHTSFNDCTPYDFTMNDHTAPADPRVITFPYDPNPMQYTPRCMKIQAGQTVTWRGAFQYHPLEPAGGDVPSPITIDPMPSGTERAIVFPNAGFFGFECMTHEAPAMYGAIFVVP
jgi:plastocyanin